MSAVYRILIRRGAQIKRRHYIRYLTVVAIALLLACSLSMEVPRTRALNRSPIPFLAYYYIWFEPNSWDRAKSDLPTLGPYSSDDPAVMQQHIRWAKRAGINGFIVSWKGTDKLNRRLEQLVTIANKENFKLSIIYQGLDFQRNPLPVNQIASDLDYFATKFADNSVFDMFGRPVIILSGTWKFSRDDLAKVTGQRRQRILILASERNTKDYQRIADIFDGDAYYWSSVDPEKHTGYEDKLTDMGKAIHAERGLWFAPAAPGFDARLIGGKRVIERKAGETLQRQVDAALQASPDAVGLISWNEFSENSHIEPSGLYGMQYLNLLSDLRREVVPDVGDFDSSDPGDTQVRPDGLIILGTALLLVVASFALIAWRALHNHDVKESATNSP